MVPTENSAAISIADGTFRNSIAISVADGTRRNSTEISLTDGTYPKQYSNICS